MTTQQDDIVVDREVVQSVDPLRRVFAAAIEAVIEAMPGDSFARETIINQIIEVHQRTKAAIVRRYVN